MFNGYGLGGAIKDIKLTPEEVEKLKSSLIEWDGEFYPKIFKWKNSEDLYRVCVKQQLEIERLKDVIKNKHLKEIERLNNNWNKLKKWIEEYRNETGLSEYETGISDALYDTLKKMKALQGSDKE